MGARPVGRLAGVAGPRGHQCRDTSLSRGQAIELPQDPNTHTGYHPLSYLTRGLPPPVQMDTILVPLDSRLNMAPAPHL